MILLAAWHAQKPVFLYTIISIALSLLKFLAVAMTDTEPVKPEVMTSSPAKRPNVQRYKLSKLADQNLAEIWIHHQRMDSERHLS